MKYSVVGSVALPSLALLASYAFAEEQQPPANGTATEQGAPSLLPPAEPQPSFMDQTDGSGTTVPGDASEGPSEAQKIVDSLVMREGAIDLPGGQAKVTLAKGFAYLDEADARKLIVDLYGNRPAAADDVLGVLLQRDVSPLAAESWFAVITYEADGHVSDDDASAINYDDLLKQMQDETIQANVERRKEGYEPIELVGWAQTPSYDKVGHKLYWAKDLKFGKADGHTLNYAIRVLGRTGVLQVNIVGDIKQLAEINPKVPELLSMVSFNEGQRYADFDESTDAVAAYGLAGLIAGGVAAKAGLFKGLLALLLASKKFLIIGAVAFGGAIWGGVKWLFGRKSG